MLDGWTSAGSNGSSASVPGLDLGDDVAVGEQHRDTTLATDHAVTCVSECIVRTIVR